MTEVIKRISHIISAVQLQGVRLVETSAKSFIRSPKEAGKIDLLVDTSTQPPNLPDDGLLYIELSINTLVTSQERTLVSLVATYELTYVIPKEMPVSQEDLNDFARLNAMFNVWPYWREYVQNTITRMNLPPLVLPLFRVKEAAKQVEQASERAITAAQA